MWTRAPGGDKGARDGQADAARTAGDEHSLDLGHGVAHESIMTRHGAETRPTDDFAAALTSHAHMPTKGAPRGVES